MIAAVEELAPVVGTRAACEVLDVVRATVYRSRRPPDSEPAGEKPRRRFPRGLSEPERQAVLDVAHSDRFADQAPASIVATLLDEGDYLCSIRTMYRILADNGEVRERRDQLRHPAYTKPELLATAPNEVWSWDMTKLMGPAKWTYFYLLVMLDIFSRYVVGWMISEREDAEIAKAFVAETVAKQGNPRGLVIHADRGTAQTAKPLALLMADLGVTKSHSRPHTSNDNPFSEAAFKTLKYRPNFPKRFGCIEDARIFGREFFTWYNESHRHSGVALMTPQAVHYGQAEGLQVIRGKALLAAYEAHPERFVKGEPRPWP
jgi:putative transposase